MKEHVNLSWMSILVDDSVVIVDDLVDYFVDRCG